MCGFICGTGSFNVNLCIGIKMLKINYLLFTAVNKKKKRQYNKSNKKGYKKWNLLKLKKLKKIQKAFIKNSVC